MTAPNRPSTSAQLAAPIVRWTAWLASPTAALCGLLTGLQMAVGVMIGATFGGVNFWLLARALDKMVAQTQASRSSSKWALPVAMLLKWPLLALVLAGLLLYVPINPIGFCTGAILALAAGTAAASVARKTP